MVKFLGSEHHYLECNEQTLADMLNHPDMVASMADVGSRIGKLFSVGKIVDQWEALLEGL